jgi:hypothetical protein
MNAIHANRNRIQVLVVLVATLLVAGLFGCAPEAPAEETKAGQPSPAAAPRAAEPVRLLVPEGTEVEVTLSTAVGSETSQVGDSVTARTLSAVTVGNQIAIPAGSTLHGQVTSVVGGTKGLKISQKGGLVVLSFDTVTTRDGSTTPIQASISKIAHSAGKTAGIIAGSAAGGALLGQILGGETKDAAVGAVLGGAIGTGIAAGTKGKALKVPAGTELTMVLDQNLSINRS